MITPTHQSAHRVSELIQQAHHHVEASSGDPWIGLSMATLVAQAVALDRNPSQLAPAVPECRSARQCLVAVQDEMATWDWDALPAEDIRAGCRMVLDVASLVRAL